MAGSSQANSTKRIGLIFGIILLLGLSTWLVWRFWKGSVDWYWTFYPAATDWLAGEITLYDEFVYGYFHPPWTLVVILLFAVFPYFLSQALVFVATLVALIFTVYVFSTPTRTRPWAYALSLVNLHVFDLLNRGQISFFAPLGTALCWLAFRQKNPFLMSVGYFSLLLVPPNTIPVGLFFIFKTWQTWDRRSWFVSLSLPSFVVLAALVLMPGWPIRWVANLQFLQPRAVWVVTIWQIRETLSLPLVIPLFFVIVVLIAGVFVWRYLANWDVDAQRRTFYQLLLVIMLTYLVSPYVTSYRLVFVLAVILPVLIGWRLWVGLFLYLLTFSPLLRVKFSAGITWVDFVFVIATFIALIVFYHTQRSVTATYK